MRDETYQRVADALDRYLFEENYIPTPTELIRDIGGGNEQVRAAAERWIAELGPRLKAAEHIQGLSAEYSAAIVKATLELEVKIKQQVRAELGRYAQEADAKVAAAEESIALAHTNLDAARRRAEKVTGEYDILLEQKNALMAANRELEKRTADAEARNEEYRTTLHRTIADMEGKINAAKGELALERTHYASMEKRLTAEVSQLKTELNTEKKQHTAAVESLRAKLTETQDALAQRVGRIAALQETEIKLEQRVDALNSDLAQQREAAAQALARAEELQRQSEAQRLSAERERSQLLADIETWRSSTSQRDMQIAVLSAEIKALKFAGAPETKKGRGAR